MNPYDVLNVRKNASNNEIKLSFNKLMDKYDLKNYPGDPSFAKRRMADIAEAYNILSDPQKRKEYDKAHDIHVDLHKNEKVNNNDVFTPYYNRQKTTAHIHNDYEIAQNKYNSSKNHFNDDNYSDDPINSSDSYENLTDEQAEKEAASYDHFVSRFLVLFFIVLFYILPPVINVFIRLIGEIK